MASEAFFQVPSGGLWQIFTVIGVIEHFSNNFNMSGEQNDLCLIFPLKQASAGMLACGYALSGSAEWASSDGSCETPKCRRDHVQIWPQGWRPRVRPPQLRQEPHCPRQVIAEPSRSFLFSFLLPLLLIGFVHVGELGATMCLMIHRRDLTFSPLMQV